MTSRQSRSSLGFIADATTSRLLDGSIIVNASTLTATNLQPSTTLKTDESRNIISSDLYLSDIKDYVPPGGNIFNPLTEDIDANGKDILNVGNLETTLVNNRGILYNPSVVNLNMGGFNISNTPTITTLQDKTQYQSINTSLNSTIFNGIVNPTLTLSIGNAQPGQTGYNLPTARPLIAGYVMVTPASSGNTLSFQVASDPAKVINLTASAGQSTFSGILNVGSDLKVNGVSNLVGGITANQKITLTKNIIEIQEDNVQTEAITIGNILTTGYSFPRATNSTAGQELRLQSNNKLGWYSPSTYIHFNRNLTLGSVTLLTSPTATRISIFPLLLTESTSPFPVFTTTASGALYTPTESRKAFQMSYNTMATIATNPAGGEYVFRLILRKAGPVEAVLSAFRLQMNKDQQYTISLQSVGFDIVQNDVLDVSIEGSLASTIQLDSQQVSIIAH